MNKLIEVLQIPSYTGREELVIEYIIDFCEKNNLSYFKDEHDNIYVQKGEVDIENEEYFPCVVAHMDTVHYDQIPLIDSKKNIDVKSIRTMNNKTKLYGINPETNSETGIGGDDKCGVYICLQLLLKLNKIKAAFFVQEETGMHGSKHADALFFKNVGYAIQFDAPTNNWFSKTLMNQPLWSENFFNELKPILSENNITKISSDPFTDVLKLKQKFNFCCAVFPTGYYNQHSKFEYVIAEETEQCIILGLNAIKKLGNLKYI